MKTWIGRTAVFGLCAWVLATGTLDAQTTPAAQTKHSLWKVQGQTNTVYLFGSIHFLKKDFYPLPRPIEDAYKESQIIAFEADLDEMQSPQGMLKMLSQSTYTDGTTLKDHVSKETYSSVRAHMGDNALVANALDSMKPWMVAVTLLGIELQKLGFDPEQGVDRYFFDKAKQDKKEILGLETVDFQIGLFTGMSKQEEDAMLKESLQEIGGFKKELNELTTAWKTGDAKTLEKIMLEAMRDYPDIHKKLLLDRNKAWVEKIEKLRAAGKNVFVVVGAAHLVGKESVVDLLAKKGFKVQQL
jgi:uncharacterized protein YbaP (TraB family)